MKKRLIWYILAFVLVVVSLISGILTSVVQVREHELASRPPVSLQDLDELGKRLDPSTKSQNPQVDETAESAQPETITPTSIPTRLERSLSTQELAKLFKSTRQKDRLEKWAEATLLKTVGSASHALGRATTAEYVHIPAEIGFDMMALGNWESARRNLWAAVDVYEASYPANCKNVLGRLAWLENDPEKAAHLLQLACQGEFLKPTRHQGELAHSARAAARQLMNAYTLCMATDSAVLAEHYLARLRTEYPTQAREFEERGEIPSQEKP